MIQNSHRLFLLYFNHGTTQNGNYTTDVGDAFKRHEVHRFRAC